MDYTSEVDSVGLGDIELVMRLSGVVCEQMKERKKQTKETHIFILEYCVNGDSFSQPFPHLCMRLIK